MIPTYPIIDASTWEPYRDEPMGSKQKVWLIKNNARWLFKEPKQKGEDWAEKVAAEIARLLGLPHAEVELAVRGTAVGVLSKDFVTNPTDVQLVHGNELMAEFIPGYQPSGANWKVPQHTVPRILHVLSQPFIHIPKTVVVPAALATAPELFCGYLMFDAFIGNTDRHHENWAVIHWQRLVDGQRYGELAPTFDHASCLGREMTDEQRHERMTTKDRNRTVEAYLARTPSRLHRDEQTVKPIHPAEAFRMAAAVHQAAGAAWLNRLGAVPTRALQDVLDAIPASRISNIGRSFALMVLEYNRRHLLQGSP